MLESKLKSFIEELIQEIEEEELDEVTTTANVDVYQTPFAFSGGRKKDKKKKDSIVKSSGYTKVDEVKIKRPVNRWLELKNDETRSPNQKLAVGLKELKYQLAEVEKFFNWYNKIKTMNELDKNSYWKRTHRHIYNVKERLIDIANSIKELDQ